MHVPSLSDFAGGPELEWLHGGSNIELTVRDNHVSTPIEVLCGNVLLGVGGILRVDLYVLWASNSGRVNWKDGFELRVRSVVPGRGSVGLRGHDGVGVDE